MAFSWIVGLSAITVNERSQLMNKEIVGVLLFFVGLGAVSFGVIQLQQGWSEDPKVQQPVFVQDH